MTQMPQLPKELEDYADQIYALEVPCYNYDVAWLRGGPLPRTRLGGYPDLPQSFEWPVWSSGDGTPLDFLMQIDLAEVADRDQSELFPKDGLLSIFIKNREMIMGEPDRCHVAWFPADTPLASRLPPPNLDHRFPVAALILYKGESIPVEGDFAVERFRAQNNLEDDSYRKAYLDIMISHIRNSSIPPEAQENQIFGHHPCYQGHRDSRIFIAREFEERFGVADGRSEREKAEDWQFILQLRCLDEHGLIWMDAAALSFWIRRQDLAERRFDRVWTSLD